MHLDAVKLHKRMQDLMKIVLFWKKVHDGMKFDKLLVVTIVTTSTEL